MEPLLVSGFWEFGFGGPAKELVFTFLSRAPRIARERAPYRLSYPGARVTTGEISLFPDHHWRQRYHGTFRWY
jgi:hypothetical protein